MQKVLFVRAEMQFEILLYETSNDVIKCILIDIFLSYVVMNSLKKWLMMMSYQTGVVRRVQMPQIQRQRMRFRI